jgi:dimethylaniline monooxygenase (N-oxide forming)
MMNWTFYTILITLQWYVPSLYRWMTNSIFDGIIRKNWGPNHMKSRFHLQSGNVCLPRISDRFMSLVKEDAIVSLPNIQRVTGPKSIQLDNGETLHDIDTIIACTGYELDVSQLESVFAMHQFPNGVSLPDLYMNVFPTRYADSFAFLTCAHFPYNACTVRELSAMAVAQVWAGKSSLPSVSAMTAHAQAYQKWYVSELNIYPDVPAGWIHPYRFLRWVHDAAGTGMYQNTGWFSWPAWKFWWNDHKLYRFMTTGVLTPQMFVLFETGKRKAWKGARDAIIKVNTQLERDYPKKANKTKTS